MTALVIANGSLNDSFLSQTRQTTTPPNLVAEPFIVSSQEGETKYSYRRKVCYFGNLGEQNSIVRP